MCGAKMFNVVRRSVKCNLNPIKLHEHYSTCDVECGRNLTHTRTKPMAHNFTHTGKVIKSPEEKRWALRADVK